MIVATYARVSTDRQEKEETIQSQIAAIKQYVKDNGHTIVKEYKTMAGVEPYLQDLV